MKNVNNTSQIETMQAIDLDSWGKTVTIDEANQVMSVGSEIIKQTFLNLLFSWQKYNQSN
ncbi:MAG: hypothetical protein FWE03_03565 [Firmicutes bacterium]|nr:hypothetical protein [Bacillota bacterium]